AGGTGTAAAAAISNTATVHTSGATSFGLLAQSIGGGGGAALLAGVQGPGSVVLGASAGSSFDAGAVTVPNSAAVSTQAALAHGIVAQSIGGGGGLFLGTNAAGAQTSFNVSASATLVGGIGEAVSVTNTSALSVSGAGAHGIVAQSIGGGGGLVGGGNFASTLSSTGPFAGSAGGTGTAGAVTVAQTGNITASGADAFGIFAQSNGTSGNGAITVTINSGTISGGSGNGAGIALHDGAANSVTNHGTVQSSGLIGGYSIKA